MNLCWSASGKGENGTQQFRLFSIYLFLRIKYSVDKLLVRDLAVEMALGHIIVYLEFDVLKSSSPTRVQMWSDGFR